MAITDDVLQQAIDAVAAHGSKAAAARVLGLSTTTLKDRLTIAVRKGLEPQNQALLVGDKAAPPEGYMLKGTTTHYKGDGTVISQYVKTDRSLEQLFKTQHTVLGELCKTLKPLKVIPGPKRLPSEFLTLYTLTDCHVGMLAWDKEAGEDWDLNIAEDCLVGTFIRMIDASPPAKTGIVNQLGDFLHFDSLSPMTPTNHHILDADSRYQKMVEVAVRILRRVIEHALTKHEKVVVYMHEGNHDPAGSVWLRVMFAQLYKDNPRVTVGMSPNPYVCYQHGQTLLGFHHGHLTKNGSLPQIFAAKFSKEWGTSEYRYVHTGHRHHVEEKEHPGIKVIQHPTLAAPDAYAARGGWLSKRQATSITYHEHTGEFARGIFIPTTK
jgi:hypothetical protein